MSSQTFNFPKTSCVYQIVNKINGRIYVGSAINMYRRYNVHVSMLKQNKSKNIFLQNDWNKYGSDNFYFQILEHVAENKLLVVEQQYIDILHNEQNNCYNFCSIAGNWLNKKHSEISKQKMSQARKGKKLSLETCKRMSESRKGKKPNCISVPKFGAENYNFGKFGTESKTAKKVYQYDLDGNYINEHGSVVDASKATGACKTSISGCCHFKLKKAGNFKWSYIKANNHNEVKVQ